MAWTTTGLYKLYVCTLDQKMALNNRKIVFTVDSHIGRGKIESLQAITFKFHTADMMPTQVW